VIRKSDGQTVGEYTYDSMNRRFRKVVSNNGIDGDATNGTTEYFYKDWQVVEEQDGSDNVERQYVYGRYIDEPLTLDNRSGGQTVADLNDGSGDDRLFYHCNTQYSTFALTDEIGSIVEGYQYDAYGRQTVITDPGSDGEWFTDDDTLEVNGDSEVGNTYMFQGRRFDLESGMYFYRNRYYNSLLGRFISRDPMGVWYDTNNFGNGYSSFVSSPLKTGDPFGFQEDDFTWYNPYEVSGWVLRETGEAVSHVPVVGDSTGSSIRSLGYQQEALGELLELDPYSAYAEAKTSVKYTGATFTQAWETPQEVVGLLSTIPLAFTEGAPSFDYKYGPGLFGQEKTVLVTK